MRAKLVSRQRKKNTAPAHLPFGAGEYGPGLGARSRGSEEGRAEAGLAAFMTCVSIGFMKEQTTNMRNRACITNLWKLSGVHKLVTRTVVSLVAWSDGWP